MSRVKRLKPQNQPLWLLRRQWFGNGNAGQQSANTCQWINDQCSRSCRQADMWSEACALSRIQATKDRIISFKCLKNYFCFNLRLCNLAFLDSLEQSILFKSLFAPFWHVFKNIFRLTNNNGSVRSNFLKMLSIKNQTKTTNCQIGFCYYGGNFNNAFIFDFQSDN